MVKDVIMMLNKRENPERDPKGNNKPKMLLIRWIFVSGTLGSRTKKANVQPVGEYIPVYIYSSQQR
jgi:hypothetical protein